jgi:hypothetical protein
MTTFTESRHAAEFIMSEAAGHRSRDNATLLSGQNLQAGTVLTLDVSSTPSSKVFKAWDGSRDSDETHDPYPTAILLNDGDASDGNLAVAVIARDAEVNKNLLTYPTQSEEEADMIRLLALVGIIVRS